MDHVVGARWNTLALAFHWHAQHYVAITGCPANNACATRLGMVEPQRRETARRPEAQRRAARVAPMVEPQRVSLSWAPDSLVNAVLLHRIHWGKARRRV